MGEEKSVGAAGKIKSSFGGVRGNAEPGCAKAAQEIEIYIPPGPRLGGKVIEAIKVTKAFGEKILFQDMDFVLPPNAIIGVIGPNGAGKTTLFRMITGQEKPDSGSLGSAIA